MSKPNQSKKGFTLIELLTVIAILAILGAIIFPTVGQFRTLAKKTSDSNDLRNIVQASQLFAAQNGERFVDPTQSLAGDGVIETGGADLADVAAILAFGGELTDPRTWMSANEPNRNTETGALYTAATAAEAAGSGGSIIEGDLSRGSYEASDFSFSYVTGLRTYMSANTPVAFTRMSDTSTSTWGATDAYTQSGGHIAFLGGSVSWYEDLTGKLIDENGDAVNNIDATLPTGALIRDAQ